MSRMFNGYAQAEKALNRGKSGMIRCMQDLWQSMVYQLIAELLA